MTEKEIWLKRIDRVARLERQSRWVRLLNSPVKRIYGLVFSKMIFPSQKKPNYTAAKLIFNSRMQVALPDGLDLFLCGCKSHDSEIRLTKWLIQTLKEGEIFFDVGAHFGFFTLLASKLVDYNGKVFSFEPSAFSFNLLHSNTDELSNVKAIQCAVGKETGSVHFLEMGAGQTEASGMVDEKNLTESISTLLINSISLDDFVKKENVIPHYIKIDAEGSEDKVLSGMKQLLLTQKPTIIMEYWSKNFHHNSTHHTAMKILFDAGYRMNLIDDNGKLFVSDDAEYFCAARNLESDNIIFTA